MVVVAGKYGWRETPTQPGYIFLLWKVMSEGRTDGQVKDWISLQLRVEESRREGKKRVVMLPVPGRDGEEVEVVTRDRDTIAVIRSAVLRVPESIFQGLALTIPGLSEFRTQEQQKHLWSPEDERNPEISVAIRECWEAMRLLRLDAGVESRELTQVEAEGIGLAWKATRAGQGLNLVSVFHLASLYRLSDEHVIAAQPNNHFVTVQPWLGPKESEAYFESLTAETQFSRHGTELLLSHLRAIGQQMEEEHRKWEEELIAEDQAAFDRGETIFVGEFRS